MRVVVRSQSVVLQSTSGDEYVFQETGTTAQARRIAGRLERDLANHGWEAVAAHYRLPSRFVQSEAPGSEPEPEPVVATPPDPPASTRFRVETRPAHDDRSALGWIGRIVTSIFDGGIQMFTPTYVDVVDKRSCSVVCSYYATTPFDIQGACDMYKRDLEALDPESFLAKYCEN